MKSKTLNGILLAATAVGLLSGCAYCAAILATYGSVQLAQRWCEHCAEHMDSAPKGVTP